MFYILWFSFLSIVDSCIPSFDDLPPVIIHKTCLDRRYACQAGYFCGPHGCAKRRKVLGTKTLTISGNEGEFSECCEQHQLPDDCLTYCSYSRYTWISSHLLSGSHSCPYSALPIVHNCATRQRDHRKCCESTKQVPSECLEYCAPLKTRKQLDFSKLHCLNYIESYRNCFYFGYYG